MSERTAAVTILSLMTLALLAWASPGTLLTVAVTVGACALAVYRIFYYTPKRKEDS